MLCQCMFSLRYWQTIYNLLCFPHDFLVTCAPTFSLQSCATIELLFSARGSQCSTELTGLLTWKNSFEYQVLVF